MNENPRAPRYYQEDYTESSESQPNPDRNEKQLSGPRIIKDDSNERVSEYLKCNGVNHWREWVTLNHGDNTVLVTKDSKMVACTCL